MIAGVDEVGRGPLVGPVVVAAVILGQPIAGLTDSKKLTSNKRLELAQVIKREAVAYSVVALSAAEVDTLNILGATLEGMRRAVAALPEGLTRVLIDGNKIPPGLPCEAQAIVKGDLKEPAISAASILAKVHRDAWCDDYHKRYPEFGFDRHKGYPTREHLDALQRLGPTPEHRRSFRPVAQRELGF